MSKRLARKAQAAAKSQIPDLSFNTDGDAFRHPTIFGNANPVYIVARKPSSTTSKKALEKWEAKDGPKSRNSLQLTSKELSEEIGEELNRYLLVGWVPQTQKQPGDQSKEHSKRKPGPVGLDRPGEDDIIAFNEDNDEFPWMAVIRCVEEEVSHTVIGTYVLLRQKDDLCTPYTINQKDVYYLSLYRDLTSNKKDRPAAWNKVASQYAYQAQKKPETAKSKKLQHSRDQAKLILLPNQSLSNELGMLFGSYTAEKRPWCLEEMVDILQSLDKDIKYTPLDNPHMLALADAGGDDEEIFTQEKADAMVKEARVAWPDVSPLNSHHIHLLAQGMRETGLSVAHAHFKAFVQEGCYQISRFQGEEGVSVERLIEIATQAAETVQRVSGFQTSPLSNTILDKESLKLILAATKAKLKEMVEFDEDFVKMMKNAAGDQALETNFQDIWGKYCDSSDTDAARAAFNDITRLIIAAIRQRDAHKGEAIKELIEIFEQAGF